MYRRFSFSWSQRQKWKKSRKIKEKLSATLTTCCICSSSPCPRKEPGVESRKHESDEMKNLKMWKLDISEGIVCKSHLSSLCPSQPSLPPALGLIYIWKQNRGGWTNSVLGPSVLGTCHAGQVSWGCGIPEMLLISLCSIRLPNLQMAKTKIGSLGTGSQNLKGIYDIGVFIF